MGWTTTVRSHLLCISHRLPTAQQSLTSSSPVSDDTGMRKIDVRGVQNILHESTPACTLHGNACHLLLAQHRASGLPRAQGQAFCILSSAYATMTGPCRKIRLNILEQVSSHPCVHSWQQLMSFVWSSIPYGRSRMYCAPKKTQGCPSCPRGGHCSCSSGMSAGFTDLLSCSAEAPPWPHTHTLP